MHDDAPWRTSRTRLALRPTGAHPGRAPRTARLVAGACCAVFVARSGVAAAADPSVDLRGWQASVDAEAGTTLEPASAPATGAWNAGVRMHWALRPVEITSSTGAEVVPIEHQVSADLVAGVGIAHRVLLGIDLPYVVAQTGDRIEDADLRGALGASRAPLVAIGDLGLQGKLVLLRPDGGEGADGGAGGGVGIALLQRVSLPTGDETGWIGEGAATGTTRLLVEWRSAPLSALVAGGVKFRGEKETFLCHGLPSQAPADCPARFGHELPLAAGVVVRPSGLGIDDGGRTSVHGEVRTYLPLSPIGPFERAEPAGAFGSLAARLRVRDVSLFGGVEVAFTDGVGNAPVRVSLGVDFAPRDHDGDEDGRDDEVDQCRELPEDRDGFEDDDGCPEVDDDQDRIPDGEDRCPREAAPGTADGCPSASRGASPPAPAGAADSTAAPPAAGPPIAAPPAAGTPTAAPPTPATPPTPAPGSAPTAPVAPASPAAPAVVAASGEDPDGDTFVGAADRCPAEGETFDGRTDDDGCPEAKPATGKAPPLLAELVTKDGASVLTLRGPIAFDAAAALTPASEPTVRAVAAIVKRQPGSRLLLGARPATGRPESAQKRSFALAQALRGLIGRDDAVKVVDWDQVKGAPLADVYGVGVVLAR